MEQETKKYINNEITKFAEEVNGLLDEKLNETTFDEEIKEIKEQLSDLTENVKQVKDDFEELRDLIEKEIRERGNTDEILAIALISLDSHWESKHKEKLFDEHMKKLIEEIQDNKKNNPEGLHEDGL